MKGNLIYVILLLSINNMLARKYRLAF